MAYRWAEPLWGSLTVMPLRARLCPLPFACPPIVRRSSGVVPLRCRFVWGFCGPKDKLRFGPLRTESPRLLPNRAHTSALQSSCQHKRRKQTCVPCHSAQSKQARPASIHGSQQLLHTTIIANPMDSNTAKNNHVDHTNLPVDQADILVQVTYGTYPETPLVAHTAPAQHCSARWSLLMRIRTRVTAHAPHACVQASRLTPTHANTHRA